jgi:hypothetical protein
MSDNVKLGKYGTGWTKGGDRFKYTAPRSSSTQGGDHAIPRGVAEEILASKRGGWIKSSGSRFGKDTRAVSAEAEMYIPPGIGDRSLSPSRRTAAFAMTTPRMSLSGDGSAQRTRSADPMAAAGGDFLYNPPGMVDELLKSKRGSSYFKGNDRFSHVRKSETANADMFTGLGMAEEMSRSRQNPMKASATNRFPEQRRSASAQPQVKEGTESLYTARGVGDVPVKKGTSSSFGGTANRFPEHKPVHQGEYTEQSHQTIGGQAEKQRGRATWSKQTTPRLALVNATSGGGTSTYTPKDFSEGSRTVHLGRGGDRFKGSQGGPGQCMAPYYNPPSFVEMILRK